MEKILDKGALGKKCPLGEKYCNFGCDFYFSEMLEAPIEVSECYQKKKTELFHKA